MYATSRHVCSSVSRGKGGIWVPGTPARMAWKRSPSSLPWANRPVLSAGPRSPWPAGPWHDWHVWSYKVRPATAASALPASGFFVVSDCWAVDTVAPMAAAATTTHIGRREPTLSCLVALAEVVAAVGHDEGAVRCRVHADPVALALGRWLDVGNHLVRGVVRAVARERKMGLPEPLKARDFLDTF